MKIALLIIYNHRYDKNIERLETIYAGKFTHIFHIMPFYDGIRENVIPVYESSYYFQSYLSQAYVHLKKQGFTHFFVVADDMIIHPSLHENNLLEKMGLAEDECYIDYLLKLQELDYVWRQTWAMEYKVKQKGVEIAGFLPCVEEAKKQFDKYQIPYSALSVKPFIGRRIKYLWSYIKNLRRRNLDYPLVGGYADILVLTSEMMDKFSLYCGAFAATKLFVELAIPTALVLSTDKLKVTSDLKGWESGAMWKGRIKEFAEEYDYSFEKLMMNYPDKKLFLHPIKLSKWK